VPTTAAELTWSATSSHELAAEVEALAAAATAADGTAPLSDQVLRHLRRPGVEHLLARGGGISTDDILRDSSDTRKAGALVGYAQLDAAAATPDGTADPVAELVVHPAHRRAGVGSAMLTALLERAPELRVWAHGAHPGAAALATRFRFAAERELWRMHRSLREPFADPVLPDGVALRPFATGIDEPELLRVNNAAFSWHPEQGGWTLADVTEREAEPWFDAAGLLLAVDVAAPAHVVGFHWTKVHPAEPDGTEPIGEVYVLAVDPAARGRRLGPALTLAGLRHLRDRGLAAVLLYVEADNTAAVTVYRDLGFAPWGGDVSYRHTGPSSAVTA
jgi:mycothiol synthase